MFDNLRADIERIRSKSEGTKPWFLIDAMLFDTGFQAVLGYRLAHWLKQTGIPGLGPLVGRWTHFCTAVEISPSAIIGPGLRISHGTGIVIGASARIGANATFLHHVTIGGRSAKRSEDMPTIGDNVFIGAGAMVLGRITVGDDVFIGVNAVVTDDVPSRSKVVLPNRTEIVSLA